ncbi:MAG: hypothetical protein U9R21_01820 [Candidatus Thermoplasmatota archaeon]|nr:hypothetical protein [Candidatus Thermoplasmatota archaeon]
MYIAATFSEVIAENFVTILVLIALILIVFFLAHAAVKIKGLSLKTKYAQVELEHKKIDTLSNKQKMEDLREAAAMLTDGEREKIEGIKADKGILARRTISLMSEIEERVARLERGTENARLGKTLGEIIKHEKKLFKR